MTHSFSRTFCSLIVIVASSVPAAGFAEDEWPPSSALPENLIASLFNAPPTAAAQLNDPLPITFSEFPIDTPILSQYKEQGIVFVQSSTFITTDGSNPTSPVLSGSPRFFGPITGQFVDRQANGIVPTSIQKFSLDAGYFDAVGSVRLTWYDREGKKIGQKVNSGQGIQKLVGEGGDISRFTIEAFADEPAGFAIDNLRIWPLETSLIFREATGDSKVFWSGSALQNYAKDLVPGLDHVGLQVDNTVFESHPGYLLGTYVSADGLESRNVAPYSGVQGQHSRKTFTHISSSTTGSPVVQVREVPLPRDIAESMKQAIEGRIAQGMGYRQFTFSLEKLQQTLSPAAQKGLLDNNATCVGIIEWAAEQAGVNGGQGFIKNSWESLSISYPVFSSDIPLFPLPTDLFQVETLELPLLSPQLMYEGGRGGLGSISFDAPLSAGEIINQWIQGFFDPVDFLIVDPLGRRLGHTAATGTVNEIPGAFYGGDADIEQFLIPNPLPGIYSLQLTGKGGVMNAAVNSADNTLVTEKSLKEGALDQKTIIVLPRKNSPGDLTGNGTISSSDRSQLFYTIPRFAVSANDPADMNRDGLVNGSDLAIFDTVASQIASISTDNTCQPVKASAVLLPLEKSFKSAVRALKTAVSSAQRGKSSALVRKAVKDARKAALEAKVDTRFSCQRIPQEIIDCGATVKPNCQQIAVEGLLSACQRNIGRTIKLAAKYMSRFRKLGVLDSQQQANATQALNKARKILRKTKAASLPDSHSQCAS